METVVIQNDAVLEKCHRWSQHADDIGLTAWTPWPATQAAHLSLTKDLCPYRTAVACRQTHLSIWASLRPGDKILVLEEDARALGKWDDIIQEVDALYEDGTLTYFGISGGRVLENGYFSGVGMFAYALDYEAASMFLREFLADPVPANKNLHIDQKLKLLAHYRFPLRSPKRLFTHDDKSPKTVRWTHP